MQQRADSNRDPFLDAAGQPRVVRGVGILSAAPRLAEVAGYIGFETVWIEVEHGPASFSEVEAQCMAAEAGGAMPTVRVPDHHRHHVLRALEAGARIVVVPLVNDAATARQIVEYGKFPPLGKRGFNTRSRGVHYGLQGIEAEFAAANTRTHLIAQIETPEAVANVEEICAVAGLSGVLVGPGDLSAAYGKPGRFTDPELIEVVAGCIRRARALGRHAGILVAPGPMLDAALEAGADLVFCGNDFGDLTKAWQALLASVRVK
ncbi:MAG TPA: aldolase/citrate lyase family protein [Abditibacteriaceae bacterium]|nr:aldolase/citrate lyase family protein [Abditibacteriaceae bacterium]